MDQRHASSISSRSKEQGNSADWSFHSIKVEEAMKEFSEFGRAQTAESIITTGVRRHNKGTDPYYSQDSSKQTPAVVKRQPHHLQDHS